MTRRVLLQHAGVAGVGAAGSWLGGCGAWAPDVAVSVTYPEGLDPAALAERYVDLTLALAKHQPSLVEAWLGPETRRAGTRTPAPVLQTATSRLVADVERLLQSSAWAALRAMPLASGAERATVATRVRYLSGQIRALDLAARRLVGEGATFADEADRGFGHRAPPRDGTALDALRQRLSADLPGPGTLAERHARFRKSMAVPADRVEAVFRAAVDWCRTAARDRMPLPQGETLTTRAADETGWAAFSRPTGARTSELWVSKRGGADAAHVLQLAAHEAVPGHHAQHVLATNTVVERDGWTERLLHPSFGPHRLLAEGAAEAGAALLLSPDVRERVCREVLLPAAGQSPAVAARLARVERLTAELDLEVAYIAADYLDTSLGTEAATIRLREEALVLDPSGMVGFIEKQRSRVLAYPVGRRLVIDAIAAEDDASRWRRLTAIATTLTLPDESMAIATPT